MIKARKEPADSLRRELERALIHGPDTRTIDALELALARADAAQQLIGMRTVCIGEHIIAMLRSGKDVVLEHQKITLIRASDLRQVL